ncbi:MAG: hypothetical protein KA477_02570 [Candidatus Levybacteria bacterium]|nr:hypothetical protein [Candidatus Levybacteria bacterium]
MIDPVQAVLLFVIVLLTVLLVILGVQVFFILKNFRRTVDHLNNVLENTESITQSVSQPASMVSDLISNTKSLSIIARLLKGSKK